LKINDLLASPGALFLLKSFYFFLAIDSLAQHLLVALSLSAELVVSEDLLGLVVAEELEVALLVKKTFLSLEFALLLLLSLPLVFKHLSLHVGELAFLLLRLGAGVLLPVEDGLGVANQLFLLLYLLALALLLFQEV
jgi:hypothetical protein